MLLLCLVRPSYRLLVQERLPNYIPTRNKAGSPGSSPRVHPASSNFGSDRWKRTQYIPSIDVYSGFGCLFDFELAFLHSCFRELLLHKIPIDCES
jgi:hypothetical protein